MRTKIEVKDVRKSFASDKGPLRVVDGVSFTVGDGEFVAIVGPSGCGKSTLHEHHRGLRPPRSGIRRRSTAWSGASRARRAS